MREFARRLRLPVSEFRRYVTEGEWEEARADNVKESRKKIYNRMNKQVEIQAELELKIQQLEIIKIEQEVNFLLEYYSRYGDLFVRNIKTGEIEYTTKGQPKTLEIPASVQDILKRKNMTEYMQGLQKILKIQDLESPENELPDSDVFSIESNTKGEAQKLLNMAANAKKSGS